MKKIITSKYLFQGKKNLMKNQDKELGKSNWLP